MNHHLFRLRVDLSASFDWSWEGARAFGAVSNAWRGEIVEVDQDQAKIYIRLDDGSKSPSRGQVVVQPFGFLESLHRLFSAVSAEDDGAKKVCSALHVGLAGATGDLATIQIPNNPLPSRIAEIWGQSWGILWGPPGTGKTYAIGEMIAAALGTDDERILIVSTTNKATDRAAIEICKQLPNCPTATLEDVIRLGAGASFGDIRYNGFEAILAPGEEWLRERRERLSALTDLYEREQESEGRARLNAEITKIRNELAVAPHLFLNSRARVVVTTAFAAVQFAASDEARTFLENGNAPFSTVIIDEAGLLSRAAVAALSTLAARRVVLVGDPCQLSPISRMNRVLARDEAQWLAESGLGHLVHTTSMPTGVCCLLEQRRMHPDIRAAVSGYQYGNRLRDTPGMSNRSFPIDDLLQGKPRAIWYVLDDHPGLTRSKELRAQRGKGNRSWMRDASQTVLERIFHLHPLMKHADGLYVTPFVAQTRLINEFFDHNKIDTWRASTTHRQQGMEAPYVIFDTVNAGSTAWSHFEWKRLVNVGMSRAQHVLIVLASQLEMEQPYLRELKALLAPMVLRGEGGRIQWHHVTPPPGNASFEIRCHDATSIGAQLELRRAQHAVLSYEQEDLCNLKHLDDGKPRLVRGVAGSGKTEVLARWLARTLKERPNGTLAVIYCNEALRGLLEEKIDAACAAEGSSPPIASGNCKVKLMHICTVLQDFELKNGLRPPADKDKYELEKRATRLLATKTSPIWRGLFVDEAQDLGAQTMDFLFRLVEQTDVNEPNSKEIRVFLDNAQNLYKRTPPEWKELGLNMQGRSAVMRESFRSTAPITEFALNVLYRLEPKLKDDDDHKELVTFRLLEAQSRNGREWWRVHFNRVDGPLPIFRQFNDGGAELQELADRVVDWIFDEHVRPCDIRIIALAPDKQTAIAEIIYKRLAGISGGHDVHIIVQTSERYTSDPNTIVITTAQSYKGYEAEIVAILGVNAFTVRNRRLTSQLYVAMTRARSLLYISGNTYVQGQRQGQGPGYRIMVELQNALDDISTPPLDDFAN